MRVDYEELPAVLTVDGALAAGAPLVQDPSTRGPNDALADTNVLREHVIDWGDVERGDGATCVVENTYTFPMVTHFAIEPHAFIAAPDGDGIAVWSSIQHPYLLQRILARCPRAAAGQGPRPRAGSRRRVRRQAARQVRAAAGVHGAPARPAVPARADASRRRSRRCAGRKRRSRVRTGFNNDGSFAFQDIDADYLIGAYADIADRVVGKGTYIGNGPYNWPDARINARSVLSHTVPSTAFRGFGNPQINWAVESQHRRGGAAAGHRPARDPAAATWPNYGDKFVPFDTACDGRVGAEREQGRRADRMGHARSRPAGVAASRWASSRGRRPGLSYSLVRLLADGSAIVYCGTSDMGQGARTIFAQMSATSSASRSTA